VIAAAFAHVLWVNAYTSVPAVRWTVLALVLGAAGSLFWIRVAKPGWDGERGRLGEEVLRRYAPADLAWWSALVCGPPAMAADAVAALRRLGMPPAAIQVGGFE
jgi:ferredoxin-NADP reductase